MHGRAANAAGTRQRIPFGRSKSCLVLIFVRAAGIHVGDDAFNVQLDDGRLSFVAEEELQRFPAVLIKSF